MRSGDVSPLVAYESMGRDAMLAIPFLILAIALAAFLGPSLTNAMIAIGITATPIFVRLTRGQVLSVKVEDYVEAIHILNERNPQANVVSAWLGPRAGRAAMATRMRLADSQRVVALAELSDGSFWMHDAEVIVTLGACLEEPI